ncbi:hypothetical protein [Microvirga zambiensis]|jgi:hypothetical protein|uniref:hypothetical protein n=1 Tax=Microvirga zambiensis TaxID=1402137 RepID=UPI0019201D6E|nr:hypothetical protein [Microvirga zambiensis]
MDIVLLNVMGSAALASAIVAGIMTQRLSREIAGLATIKPDPLPERLRHSRLMAWWRKT